MHVPLNGFMAALHNFEDMRWYSASYTLFDY